MRVDYVRVDQVDIFVALCYFIIAACLIYPPTEFISAGLTVQNIFSSVLGSEQMYFVYYHMKRTAVTLLFHSILPLGFYLWFGFFTTNFSIFKPWTLTLFWQYYLLLSLVLPACVALLVYFWSRKRWKNHPMAQTLQQFATANNNWQSVASSVNVEFRRIDKFSTGPIGRRLIVTDSWIILTSTYHVKIAHQTDVHLTLVGADEHEVAYESAQGAQFLTISVSNIHAHISSFNIRLNAADYSELQEKLQSPVRNARDIVIRQSLSDRFIAAFIKQVGDNPHYKLPEDVDLESCIGCMQKPANCKLVRHCEPVEHQDGANDRERQQCVQCYCRPMWCLDCMARWFASRQDQGQPERWMGSKSPCPTCRSVFCLLDVCIVDS